MRKIWLGVAVLVLLAAQTAFAQVQVKAWHETTASGPIYHYRLLNYSVNKVVGFDVGVDHNVRQNELATLPSGVAEADEDVPTTVIGSAINDPRSATPPGWLATCVLTEEEPNVFVHFEVSDPSAATLPNRFQPGFAIAVPAVDAAYLSGHYRVVLDNSAVLTGKLEVDLDYAPIPRATLSDPADVCKGQQVSLNVALTGNGPWKLVWSDGFQQSPAASPAIRTVVMTQATTFGLSSVSDMNRTGQVSGSAPVGVKQPVVILVHPSSQTIAKRASVSLSVSASGDLPLSYQWYQGVAGNTSVPVGTNSPSFVSPKLTKSTSYWVKVANGCGPVQSYTAAITVQ